MRIQSQTITTDITGRKAERSAEPVKKSKERRDRKQTNKERRTEGQTDNQETIERPS